MDHNLDCQDEKTPSMKLRGLKQVMRADEVAYVLNISKRAVYRLCEDGEIVSFNFSRGDVKGALRISGESVQAYFDRIYQEAVLEKGFSVPNVP